MDEGGRGGVAKRQRHGGRRRCSAYSATRPPCAIALIPAVCVRGQASIKGVPLQLAPCRAAPGRSCSPPPPPLASQRVGQRHKPMAAAPAARAGLGLAGHGARAAQAGGNTKTKEFFREVRVGRG